MAYHTALIRVLATAVLILLPPYASSDSTPRSTRPMPPEAMATLLLERTPENVNPLALEQARELAAGRPGKAWKNCLLEKEVRRIAPELKRHGVEAR